MTEENVFTLLLHSMREARKNKRYGRDCAEFERNWAPILIRMARKICNKTFRVDRNYAFLASEPQWREIFATSFEGRIADYVICHTLAPYIDAELHPRIYNNRIGMGCQAAMNQVIEDIYSVTDGYTKPARIIKWDIQGFFPNAVCDTIENEFDRLINKYSDDIVSGFDDEMPALLKWLTMVCIHCRPALHCELRTPKFFWRLYINPEKSLFFKPDGIGAPIGRWISQTGMGLYLNEEVKWLNDECLVRSTLFMDDCVMVVPERNHEYALGLIPTLRKSLSQKGIRLNEKKFYDQSAEHGVEFLGSHIKPWRIHLNNSTYSKAILRIQEFNRQRDKLRFLDKFVASFNSYSGLLKLRTDYQRLQSLRKIISPKWNTFVRRNGKKQCIGYRNEYSVRSRRALKYNIKSRRLWH